MFNFRNTLFPFFFWGPSAKVFSQNSLKGQAFDLIIAFYSATLPGSLTVAISTILLITFIKRIKIRPRFKFKRSVLAFRQPVRKDIGFWKIFILVSFTLGLLVNPKYQLGVIHSTLCPLALLLFSLGVKEILLIKQYFYRVIFVCFLLIECIIGIWSRFYLFKGIDLSGKLYSRAYYVNYNIKTSNNLTFLYDRFYSNLEIFYVLAASFYLFLFFFFCYNLLRSNPYSQKEIEET